MDKICTAIAQMLLQGVMIHQQFITYYDFLGLQGYKTCQYYHYLEESSRYEDFVLTYINYTNKIIPIHYINTDSIFIVPDNWYKYTREDIDTGTKQSAIKTGYQKWLKWERDIKVFLEQKYVELINLKQVSLALKIQQYINEVNQQIKQIQEDYLNLKTINYDLSVIAEKQWYLKEKYMKKIKNQKDNLFI